MKKKYWSLKYSDAEWTFFNDFLVLYTKWISNVISLSLTRVVPFEKRSSCRWWLWSSKSFGILATEPAGWFQWRGFFSCLGTAENQWCRCPLEPSPWSFLMISEQTHQSEKPFQNSRINSAISFFFSVHEYYHMQTIPAICGTKHMLLYCVMAVILWLYTKAASITHNTSHLWYF